MDPVTSTLVLGGINTAMGLSNAAQQRKQAETQNMIRAAEIEASPWTKMAPQTPIKFSNMNTLASVGNSLLNTWGQLEKLKEADQLRTFQQAQIDNTNAQNNMLNNLFGGGQAPAPQASMPSMEAPQGFSMPTSQSPWTLMKRS